MAQALTFEEVQALVRAIPDLEPHETRCQWSDWDIQQHGAMRGWVAGRFAYLRDDKRAGDGLAQRIEVCERHLEDPALHALMRVRMIHAERELERMVPLYVAERLLVTKDPT